jgi:nitrate reductase NapAB chaperone NapD
MSNISELYTNNHTISCYDIKFGDNVIAIDKHTKETVRGVVTAKRQCGIKRDMCSYCQFGKVIIVIQVSRQEQILSCFYDLYIEDGRKIVP